MAKIRGRSRCVGRGRKRSTRLPVPLDQEVQESIYKKYLTSQLKAEAKKKQQEARERALALPPLWPEEDE